MIYMDLNLKALFLDDNHTRHALLKLWWPSADRCYTYDECVSFLRRNSYDVVSLDHDLGVDDEMCIPGVTNKGMTGTDVAKFIATLAQKPRFAIVHSYNPSGAASMESILTEANIKTARVPFGFNKQLYTDIGQIIGL